MPATMEKVLSETRKDSHAAPVVKHADSRFSGKRVHFVGIGGSGMNGLAREVMDCGFVGIVGSGMNSLPRMLIDCGAVFSRSEPTPNTHSLILARRCAKVSRLQHGQPFSPEVDLVVRTAAVKDDHTEYLAARRFGLKV